MKNFLTTFLTVLLLTACITSYEPVDISEIDEVILFQYLVPDSDIVYEYVSEKDVNDKYYVIFRRIEGNRTAIIKVRESKKLTMGKSDRKEGVNQVTCCIIEQSENGIEVLDKRIFNEGTIRLDTVQEFVIREKLKDSLPSSNSDLIGSLVLGKYRYNELKDISFDSVQVELNSNPLFNVNRSSEDYYTTVYTLPYPDIFLFLPTRILNNDSLKIEEDQLYRNIATDNLEYRIVFRIHHNESFSEKFDFNVLMEKGAGVVETNIMRIQHDLALEKLFSNVKTDDSSISASKIKKNTYIRNNEIELDKYIKDKIDSEIYEQVVTYLNTI